LRIPVKVATYSVFMYTTDLSQALSVIGEAGWQFSPGIRL
jgi:hypothetical protein